MSAGLWVACSDEPGANGECSGFDDTCIGCRTDGQCCIQSHNCPSGSICNDELEELYDPAAEKGLCVRVICASDADCDGGKKCSLEKICKPDVCQKDGDCPGGNICIGGSCEAAPSVDLVAECVIVTQDGAIRQGQTIELTAVAKNANGAILPGIEFDWTSSNTNAVAVSGGVATGGTTDGAANLTATPAGKPSVTCSGDVSLTNFANVAGGTVRVILVRDNNGAPINNASVTLVAGGGTMSATSNASGAATFATAATVDSVTVEAAGYQYVSVIAPGTNDIFIPVPAVPDNTKAGGFRGVVDVSATRAADIKLGIAGPAIPTNLLDFGLDSLVGDSVNTLIDAPELSINMQNVALPGGVLFGFGNKAFTADTTRCQGATPGANDIGCYLVRAPGGQTAGWIVAGRLTFSQVSPIAGDLADAFGGGGGGEDFDIGGILTAVLPLLRSLRHGVLASLEITEYPMVMDAMDPSKKHGDFTKYDVHNFNADGALSVLSRVTVPNLPSLPAGGCAAGAIMIAGTVLEGRGIVPLGISAGIDALETQTADCRVAGQPKPFGETSEDLDDGQLALAMAAPHGGLEGGDLFLLLVALDLNSISGDSGIQFSGLVKRVDAVEESQNVSGGYLPFPQGTIDAGGASVAFSTPVAGATVVRIELQRDDTTWLVYAPASQANITLPNVTAPRNVLGGVSDAYLQAFSTAGSYGDTWTFGSGKTMDRLVHVVDGFVVQQCSTTAGSACLLQ